MVAYYLCILLLILVKLSSLEVDVNNPRQHIIPDKFNVHFVEANSRYNFRPTKRGFLEKHLNTYCYIGEPKTLARLLETIELHLDIEGDDYTQYDGTTPQDVEEHYNEHRSLFSFSLFSQKRSRLPLSPFVQQCIGIETVQPYTIRLVQEKMDYVRLVMLLSGIFIFIFASNLSTNSIFYYITGIVFGICSSFLLLIWLSGKLMPKRTMMYGVVIGGWTIGVYVIRMLWRNLQMIMMTYRNYVCWYIIITGLISFFLCYRWGPPQNHRSKNIIKWLLQLISLALIYLSSNFKEAIVSIIAMTVVLYYLPRVLTRVMRMKNATSVNVCCKRQCHNSGGLLGSIKKDCKQWGLNSPQHKETRTNIIPSRMSLYNTSSIRKSKNSLHTITNDYAVEALSESDLSGNENSTPNEALYQLPDGSFLLSEKPPIIFNPQQVGIMHSPMYHRSPLMASDDLDTDGDDTPRTHLSASNIRRLPSALSTPELCVKKGRRSLHLPSEFQRSSSVQRNKSRSSKLVTSAKKNVHSSFPKIRIQKPDSDESEG